MKICSCLLASLVSGLWVPRGCLLELEAGTKQWGRKFGGKDLCGAQEMGAKGKTRLHQIFCCRSKDNTELLDLEEQKER